jgi:hypothetical protein
MKFLICNARRLRTETDLEFTSVIGELTAEAKVLGDKVQAIGEPPSADQLDAVQEAVNELQRKLNRLQTEVDAWSQRTEV